MKKQKHNDTVNKVRSIFFLIIRLNSTVKAVIRTTALTAVFGLSFAFGQTNYSLSFDGVDDLVSFQNAVIPMTGDVSVQVWAYAEENNGY